ncbi:MAG TPA: nucleotide disphospho-sugar-binding domain-containing protein [Allosphingosinicella sp.]|nr:nucleotide disphospho-sugar-binding domain-containing protein [Allosphingosinicella sp.]
MTNFLIATWEGGGSVMPMLTVAEKLAGRGHRVRVMSDRCNRPEAEACGGAFIPWTRAPSRPDRSRETDSFRDWEAATPQAQLRLALERVWAGPALDYAEDVIAELRRAPADLVVSSEMLLGVIAGCEAIGQPCVAMTCNINPFGTPGIPPVGPGLVPACTPEDEAVHRAVAAGNEALFATGLPMLNAARRLLGLRPLARLADQIDAAAALLVGTSAAFDFAPPTLPPHIHYIGPQLADPPWAAPWRSPWSADDARPLILVAFSTTFQDHVGVLQAVIDGAADLPVRLLVTLGDTIAPEELRPAANCELAHSAPHDQVMPEAALVITHGGHGTVTRALTHLKPMIVVPHGRDQHDNAVRVTARGAGLSLPADAAAADFRAAIAQLLADPRYAEAAWTLGMQVADDMRQSPAAELLERLAAGCRARRRAA